MSPGTEFADRGVRATVLLHDKEMRAFLPVWKEAMRREVPLPATDDAAYASYGALGRHVLGAARGYVTWICKQLALPDPGIAVAPPPEEIPARADAYLEEVLGRWPGALAAVSTEAVEATFTANWGTVYSIDAMLEHAVMHPIRHRFQLEELMGRRGA